jgi:hypothetical protein
MAGVCGGDCGSDASDFLKVVALGPRVWREFGEVTGPGRADDPLAQKFHFCEKKLYYPPTGEQLFRSQSV